MQRKLFHPRALLVICFILFPLINAVAHTTPTLSKTPTVHNAFLEPFGNDSNFEPTVSNVLHSNNSANHLLKPLKANQAQASVVTLSSLTVTGGTLSPAFSSNTLLYTESVPFGTSSVNVTPTTTDPLATLSVTVGGISYTPNGSGVFTIPLSVGANQIDMVVTGQDAVTTKQYTLTVNQASPSTNTAISNLKVNGTTLTPVGVNYSTSVPYSPGTIAIIPTLTDPNASIQVTFGGVTVNPSSGTYSIFIPVGINSITMIVTAQDGVTTKTYNLSVTRAVASSIKTLSGLTISTGTLSPTFNSGTLVYTDDVTNLSSGITVTPTAADPNASISVNGSVVASGSASANISVPLGGTTPTDINIVVTAQNLTQQTYTIAVTNHKSTISTLSSIVLNSVSQVNKTFTGATSYTDYVTNGTSTITVTPKPADASATFTATLNGSAITQSSGSYPNEPLNVGNNTFVITVTAQDGISQTVYTLNVYRSSSSTSALLNGIAVDNGSLSPVFSQNIFSYTDIVANNISSLTVTPTWSDATTTVTVNGTTTTTGIGVSINGLAVGTNTITIGVTAQDGTFSNYILTVTRLSNDATLSGLVPSTGTLTPTFSSLTTSYTLVVSNGTNGITLKPTATNGYATILVNGTSVISGTNSISITLNVGSNIIPIVVTAQDLTTKTYTLTVTKLSNDATLNTLVSSAGPLSQVFTSGNTTYTQTVSNATSSITVTPTVNESHASIIEKLNGNTVTTGSTVSLSVGANNIFTFLVTAQDGTTKTYTLTITRISADATLSSLTSSAGSLTPAFTAGTTAYSQIVGNLTTNITVNPTVNESNAVVIEKVNGITVTTGSAASLNVGNNSITFDVTAQDGTTKQTYTLTVTRPSNDATLSSLVSTAGVLSPIFTSANTSYTQTVGNTTSTITVTPTVNESHATVIEKLNGNTVTTGSVLSLNVGNNAVTFDVTAQDGTAKLTYTITVNRLSNDASLSALASSAGSLTPAFTPGTTVYSQTVGNLTTNITVTPTVNESHAIVVEKLNGVTVATASLLTLNVGSNAITFLVTAQDGTNNNYTLTVTRPSNDATLSSLISSAGALSPIFTSANTSYTQTVGNTTSTITVTPTVNESHAIVVEKLNGVTVTTGSLLSLNVGSNLISFLVTAQDGTTNTYTLTVTRSSNDATLSALVSSAGSLTPAFTAGTTAYSQTVGNLTTNITVTPTVNESHAIVVEKVNGVTVATGSLLTLNVGSNSITFDVTAQDGTTKQTYTLAVTRLSNDATLSSLVSTAGVLSPIFTSANTSYTQTFGNTPSTITVTPTVNESHAIVVEKLNGVTVTTGSLLSLNVGSNLISFLVTAQDGTTNTYTLTVTRSSNDATLSALVSSAGSLTPAFTAGTTAYSQTVGNLTTNITVTPTVNESHAIVVEKLNGITVTTGSAVSLNIGSNAVTFDVTAQDGVTKQTYTLAVTRLSNDATLSSLVSTAGVLSPIFTSDNTSYTQTVGNTISTITVTPTVNESHAIVVEKLNGVTVTTGSVLSLNVGNNTVTFDVAAQDGNTKLTYTITVNRLSNDASFSALVSSAGSLTPAFTPGTTAYSQIVGNLTTNITVTPTVNESHAIVVEKINGVTVATSSSVSLNVGSNAVTFDVTAQDGVTKQTYTVTVTRASTDATLSSLVSSAGVLSPIFTSDNTSYTQTVGNTTSTITVTPTVNESHAIVVEKLNGITVTTGNAVSLVVGSNTITFDVTAQDGSTKQTYTLTVTRLSNDASLNALVSSAGLLSPIFTSATTSYAQAVSNATTSITLTPTVNESHATIIEKINGVTTTTGTAVSLNVGSNVVTFDVTAQDGTTKQTYTITVTRPSNDATLGSLVSSAGVLTPTFTSANTSYTQTVSNTTSTITVTQTVNESHATVIEKLNGNTIPTNTAVSLSVGANNIITFLVTAQDGTTNTYTLSVTRQSNDATLSSLTSSGGLFDQQFAPLTTSYTQTVSNSTSSITLIPISNDNSATIKVNGIVVVSGATTIITTYVGVNIIPILVTAQDGSSKTYTLTVTRQSNDATLSALTTGGTISPIFNSATTNYTQTVINSIAAITVTPTVNNSYATIKVNNISVPSGTGTSVALGVGDNTINILVTAQDGSTKAYTLIVTRQSNDATLSGLVSSAGALSPTFTPATTGYTQTVVNAISSITLTPTTNNSNASIKVNGVDVTSGTGNLINLVEGDNTINIAVTAQDGTSKAYTLVISRQSNDASLSNLVSSAGGLSPAFFKTITQYTQSVPNAVSSIALTPTTTNPYTSVTINGNVATSGTATNITLNLGDNPINTTITAQDGTTQTYTLTVTRQSNIATLQSLTVTSATNTNNLLQTFNSTTNNYVLNLSNGTSSVTLTPTLTDNTITLQSVSLNHNPINSTNKTNYNIPLAVGNNVITILLSAQDGTQNTYTLNIIRSLNTDNTLSSLGVNSGTFSPAFASGTTNYDDNVPNTTSEIVLLPTANDTTASININGYAVQSGTVSTPIPLQVGANLLNVNVTAQDGTIKSYIIKVTRAQSSVATLSDLKVSNNSLDPDFDDATFLYKVNVRNSTTSVTITPTVTDPNATVTVNGVAVNSSSTSSAIPLTNIGDNPIQIEVTAQDGTIKDYTVNVRRAPSGGAILSNLTISHGTFIPGFDYGTMSYTDTVTSQNSSITITPVANEATSTIKINGILVTSGTQSPPITLALGDNTITTDVTAQDGVTKQTYSIIVTRLKSSVSTLNNLRVSAGTLSPVFNSGTTTYLDNLPNSIDVISVTADVTDATATVTVNGTLVPSGIASLPLPLNVGSNPITIVVTAQDNSTKTYTVTVNRSPSGSAILSNLVISSGSFNPLFDSETFTYNVNVTSSTTAVNITPSLNDLTSTVTVNGVVVASGSPSLAIPLITGKNVINTIVTAQDGTTKQTYTLTVSRAASSGANLSDLAVSDGTLSPLFDNSGKTISYTYNVPYTLGNITVTPTVDNPNSSVTVNGNKVTSGTASDPIPLVEGSNIIPVVVTAQNGITNQTYTINVYRALASSVASLSNLSASVGSISPVFSSGTYSYTDVVPNITKTISITPTTTVTDEVIMINGNLVQSGTSSAAIPLAVGVNTVNVVVTSKDGNSNKTYTLNVTRSTPSSNAALQSLTINGATLNSNIDANTFSYTATLWNNDNTSKKVGFTPTAADDGATITVNGQPSTNILTTVGINAGVNAINIVVTAADGITSKTYTVLINELPTLSGITLTSNLVNTNNSVSLNPFFNANTNTYTSTLSPEATSVSFVPIFSKVGVKSALINGVLYDSAGHAPPVPLIAGANVIPVILTSADSKLTNNYTVIISRKASNVATLDSLRIDNGSMAPNFDPNIINYSVLIGNSAQGINISPKLTHPNATITINNKEETGTPVIPIPLNVGTNAIIITVTAEDGITKKTYTVIVNRDRATQTLTFNPPIFEKGVSFDLSNIIPNSKLKLSYKALDTNIARIDTNKLLLIPKQIGKTTLVITQAGNALYYPFTLSVDITVADPGSNEILVHQFVTPNNDGFNDYLLIEGIQEFKDNTVKIINRNGINVFTIKGYDNEAIKFDGHANNNGTDYLPAGTYFYIIDYTNATGVQKHKTGYFLLRY